MARVIALSNQKGGVGKSTTAMNLSTALAACGHKVLVVDLDPQGNTSTGFGLSDVSDGANAYPFVMGVATAEEALYATEVPNLSVIPATMNLAGAEVELVSAIAREYRLREALVPAKEHFDFIFIDCPPSLGLLTVNALAAADEVLIPLQCEYFALEGVSQLYQTIDIVKKNLNQDLDVMGVLLTMYDKRNNLSRNVEKDVREHLGAQVMSTVIPRNVRVSEAPSHGKPALLYDVNCAGSQAYIQLAAEVMKKSEGARV